MQKPGRSDAFVRHGTTEGGRTKFLCVLSHSLYSFFFGNPLGKSYYFESFVPRDNDSNYVGYCVGRFFFQFCN